MIVVSLCLAVVGFAVLFWRGTMDWINVLSEFLTQFSLLIGIWVAIYGIDSWRREHTGKRQMELAEETLALFYEAGDAIRSIRSSLSWSSETDDVKQGDHESETAWAARKQAAVVFKRYHNYHEIFSKLHAIRYRFMAQIGRGEAQPFEDMRKIETEILASARSLARLWAKTNFRSDEEDERH